MGIEQIRNLKENAGVLKPKVKYVIPRVSKKRAALLNAEKEKRNGDDTEKEKWFKAVNKKLTGVCQCGCGNKSSKDEINYFRNSCCHVFSKSNFPSVMYHLRNWVERAFWGGCHSVMDDTSMDRWPQMADWENIKYIFHELAPLLTDKERATKFYTHLEKLVYNK